MLPSEGGVRHTWGLKMAELRKRRSLLVSITAGSMASRAGLVRLWVRERKSQLAQISQLQYSLA
jgi:hypothetical protein